MSPSLGWGKLWHVKPREYLTRMAWCLRLRTEGKNNHVATPSHPENIRWGSKCIWRYWQSQNELFVFDIVPLFTNIGLYFLVISGPYLLLFIWKPLEDRRCGIVSQTFDHLKTTEALSDSINQLSGWKNKKCTASNVFLLNASVFVSLFLYKWHNPELYCKLASFL